MKFKQGVMVSVWTSLAYYFSTLFANTVPCQVAARVPNPQYTWSMCTLNPDLFASQTMQTLFFGFTSKAIEATIIAVVAPFIILFLLFTLISKKRKKRE